MIEGSCNTHINKGFSLRLTAGNDTAWPQDHPNALGTAPSSRKTLRTRAAQCENPLKVAQHARSARRQRRAQPPARNTNPHSARRTA